MATPNKKPSNIALLNLSDYTKLEDVARLFKQLIDFVERLKTDLTAIIEARLASLKDGKDGRDGRVGAKGDKGDRGEMGPIGRSIFGGRGEAGKDGRDGSPDTPDEIRDKLETLEGENRLDRKAIKGLQELEKKLDERISGVANSRVQTPAKAYRVHVADLSSQCDGSNKTFTVGGSHFGIIGVYGTQFPLIYRPIIDYTETSRGFVLTSEVAGPDAGQTLTAQFLK